ncbi:molybdopterin-guanine dinucleotide biosynthesis protein B [Pseudalkalibacillus sp. SCS-8]|uniref:molybdopterin-guanine dinucleotide biosynthesis protein B n=1 Tax=Pseudalkalibacillus nanhaiensis TaxID=3115291 RepID=UPI0032DB60F9
MIPILQIVGYKNSGKTTVIKNVVHHLSEAGFRAGIIKHHGHGGKPDVIEPERSDTAQFRQSGAYATAVEGDGEIHIQFQYRNPSPLKKMIELYLKLPLDVILVEGYKRAGYPKLLVVRNKEECIHLLSSSQNVIGIIHHGIDEAFEVKKTIPTFQMEDPQSYVEFILAKIENGV